MKITRSLLKNGLIAKMSVSMMLGQCLMLSPQAVLALDSEVRLAGQVVISNLADAGSLSGPKRAEIIQNNLDSALKASGQASPEAVKIKYVNGLPVLTMSGHTIATVDSATAKSENETPQSLARRWSDALKTALADESGTKAYLSQLSGATDTSSIATAPQAPRYSTTGFSQEMPQLQVPPPPMQMPPMQSQIPPQYDPGMNNNGMNNNRVVFAPAGMMIQARLSTPIASAAARDGDLVQAKISKPIILGDSQIPVDSVLEGRITNAKAGSYLGRTGAIGVEFTTLRTPDGQTVPLSARLMEGLGNYSSETDGSETIMKGETWKTKAAQAGMRGALGAGIGAATGTAIGAIAGGGRGVGRGAWSGAAIGGGVGVGQSLLLRKGKNVTIPSGTLIKLQLSQALQMAACRSTALHPSMSAYSGNF